MFDLKVHANPYAGGHRAFDHKGRAHAFVAIYGLHERYVGAEIDRDASRAEGTFVLRFSDEPVLLRCRSIPEFAYYRQHLRDGVLVPADEATAKRAGVVFRDPAEVLAEQRERAVEEWRREIEGAPTVRAPGAVPSPAPAES